MKADQILDWIIAIVILLFILAPLIGSMFSKKKVIRKKTKTTWQKQSNKRIERPIVKNIEQKQPDEQKALKKDTNKKLLNHKNLKKAIVLAEILKRPYLDDN